MRGLEAAVARDTPAPGAVLLLGSSSFRLWTNVAAAFPQYRVVNHGFGGSQLSDLNEYFDRLAVPVEPSVLLVYGGDNDLAAGKSPERVLADFRELVAQARRKLPRTRVGFLAVKPSPARENLLAAQQRANELVRDFAQGEDGLDYLDVATTLLDSTGKPEAAWFAPDRLHLNGAGYARWREALSPYLDRWASAARRTAAVPRFRAVTIDRNLEIGYGLAIADIDGSGRPDIVLADRRAIVWYRNPDWRKFLMAERLTEQDHVCVAARDIDGDGRAEVIAGAGWNPADTFTSGALFFLLPGPDLTGVWEPIRLAHDPTIHRLAWARSAGGEWSLLSLPLHGRGNRNGAGDGVRFLAYHPPTDRRAAWTTSTLNADWHQTHNFEFIESGPAGVADAVLVAAREGIFRLQPGPGGDRARWAVTTIATNGPAMPEFVGAGEVRAGRDGDGRALVASIEPMHGNQLVVYAPPPPGQSAALWTRRVLDDSLVDGHALACGDLLGQGRDQIVAGWRAMNRRGAKVGIRLYVAAEGAAGGWVSQLVDDNEMACEDLKLADLDGDGDLDIVASGRATQNVRIYFNETLRP